MGKIPIPDINTLIISATYAKTKSMAPLQDRKSRQFRRHAFVTMSPPPATPTPRHADATKPRRASRSRRSAENRPRCVRCAPASAPSFLSTWGRAIRKQGQGDKAGRSMPPPSDPGGVRPWRRSALASFAVASFGPGGVRPWRHSALTASGLGVIRLGSRCLAPARNPGPRSGPAGRSVRSWDARCARAPR